MPVHVPALHAAVPLVIAGHIVQLAPQYIGLLLGRHPSTPAHVRVFAGHVQTPATQLCIELQRTPQAPQFIVSELRVTHVPLQSDWPSALHAHAPPMQL